MIFLILFLTGSALSLGLYHLDRRARLRMGTGASDPADDTFDALSPSDKPGRSFRRIVCMTPSVTESVFALGAADRVVGVTDFCLYPPEARRLVKVGGFFNPNYEQLLQLRPDLVITQGRSEKLTAFCRRYDIALLHVRMDSLAAIYTDLLRMGEMLDCPVPAVRLCQKLVDQLEAVRIRLAGRQTRRIFFCTFRVQDGLSGLHTLGPSSTFLQELIEIAGGRNIFVDAPTGSVRISPEALLQRQPEVIIEPHPGEAATPDRQARWREPWQDFASIPAVRQGRLYFPTEDFLLIPGPRIGQTAERLAEMIHPEIVAGHDPVKRIADDGDNGKPEEIRDDQGAP
ncbi:MAG: ABC transporter substrate-binding protein [Sedimentisphaerales bacterium]|nr:ABC transporter substrate-binding protein [Sedimentisphaerales bacterium]